jgi:hypothetical protein
MKFKLVFLALGLFTALSGCIKEEDSPPSVLGEVTNLVRQSLDSLDNELESAAAELVGGVTDYTVYRTKLKEILNKVNYLNGSGYFNTQGKLLLLEPSENYMYEGTSFSDDTVIMFVINQHKPVFKNYFTAIQGYGAVVDIHPVYKGLTSFGAIEGLFLPAGFLAERITPKVAAPNEIWVMEKSGTILFEPDLAGNGKNIFTDPFFNGLEDFKTACRTIVDYDSGQTTYTYYVTGSLTETISKKVWWKTINLHQNEWKVVWSQEM